MEPTLDTSVIRRLGEEIGAASAASAFLAQFTALLDERISRIEEVFVSGDTDAQVLAVMSLHTSAVQTGAFRLGALARAALQLPREAAQDLRIVLEELKAEAVAFYLDASTYLRTCGAAHASAPALQLFQYLPAVRSPEQVAFGRV